MNLKSFFKLSTKLFILLTSQLAWSDIALVESSNQNHKVLYLQSKDQVCELNCQAGTSFDRKCTTDDKPICMQSLSFEWLFRKNANFIKMKLEKINLQKNITDERVQLKDISKSKQMLEKDVLRVEEKLASSNLSEADRKGLELRLKELKTSLAGKTTDIKKSEDKINNIEQKELPLLESKNLEIAEAFKTVEINLEANQNLIIDKGEHLYDMLTPTFSQKSIYLNEAPATNLYSGYCSYQYDAQTCTSDSWSGESSGPLVGFISAQALINECGWSARNIRFGAIKVQITSEDISTQPLETAPKYFKGVCSISNATWDSMNCGYNQTGEIKTDVYGHSTKELRLLCQELANKKRFNRSSVKELAKFTDWTF